MVVNNPYLFGDRATDRQRLDMQNFLFSNFLRANLERVVGPNVRRILDLSAGAAQTALVMREVYPQARLVCIDKDEEAIASARLSAQELNLSNVEYLVADVEQGLPEGPFDLIYASFVLFNTRYPDRVVQMAYHALRPGGHLWIKDVPPGWETAINHRSYRKLADMLTETMTAIGAHPNIMSQLPALLTTAGFIDISQEPESYGLGGTTPEGQAMLAAQLGVFYNARSVMSKIHKVPESEIERLYLDVCNAALRSNKEVGVERIGNIIARRPTA
jgi:ubiquinone/menaquinone biosynthesis C-methylase UbiE